MNFECAANWRPISRATLLISLFSVCGMQLARAQSSDKPQPDVQQMQQQIDQMQQQMQQLKDQIKALQEARKPQLRSATYEVPAAEPAPTGVAPTSSGVATGEVATAPTPEGTTQAPSSSQPERYLDLYGFVELDSGYNFRTIDPNWFDVLRPSKLPATPGQFGQDGSVFFSVRPSRIGVRGTTPTPLGELKTQFEFDMYGVGAQAGQTQIRPRHYWGQLGAFLAGQTNTTFMDIDVFPNVLDYWGPNGMVFIRQPQFRWMPIQGDTHLWIAAEIPGQSGDQGLITDRITDAGIRPRFQYPDLTGQYRYSGSLGYIQGAAVVRNVKLDQNGTSPFNLNQSLTGWGFNVSSKVNLRKDALHLQYVVGNGIENYMNDAPFDVAPILNPNPARPVKGKPLPMYSFVAYLDHNWSDKWATSLGYSQLQIQNTSLQATNAYHFGQYSTANLLYTPTTHVMYGGEFQWARRSNRTTLASGANDYKLQFTFKYTFDARIFGNSGK